MITIKDIQEGSHVWFAQHRYLVLEVCPHCGDRVRWHLRSPECLTEYHPEWKL